MVESFPLKKGNPLPLLFYYEGRQRRTASAEDQIKKEAE
tara:strand:+ start:7569 stop:7685 length:117 start_codon:yes stop_codon:yes gene_type:complete